MSRASPLYSEDICNGSQAEILARTTALASGATLQINPQFGGNTYAYLNLDNGVVNNGTITTAVLGDMVSRAGIYLYCEGYVGSANSVIDLAGEDAASGSDGGNAGSVYFYGEQRIWNTGDVLAIGGQGNASGSGQGGDGNTGELKSNGGSGDADIIFLYSTFGQTENTSTVMQVSGGAANTPGDHGAVFIDGLAVTGLF